MAPLGVTDAVTCCVTVGVRERVRVPVKLGVWLQLGVIVELPLWVLVLDGVSDVVAEREAVIDWLGDPEGVRVPVVLRTKRVW